MNKFRVFISQPMRGYTKREILAKRRQLTKLLYEKYGKDQIEIIDNLTEYEIPSWVSNPEVWLLGKSIELLASADILVQAHGTWLARGCSIENSISLSYGPFMMLTEESLKNYKQDSRLDESTALNAR